MALIVGLSAGVVAVVAMSPRSPEASEARGRLAAPAELAALRSAVATTSEASSLRSDVFNSHADPQRTTVILNQPDKRRTVAILPDGTERIRIQIGLDVYSSEGSGAGRWDRTREPFVLQTAFEAELGFVRNLERFTRFDGTDYFGSWTFMGLKGEGRLRVVNGYVSEYEVISQGRGGPYHSAMTSSEFGTAPAITAPVITAPVLSS